MAPAQNIHLPFRRRKRTMLRFRPMKTFKKFASIGNEPQHKELFAATQAPTDLFIDMLKARRQEVRAAEIAYQNAKDIGNQNGMSAADHRRGLANGAIGSLSEFRAGLAPSPRPAASRPQERQVGGDRPGQRSMRRDSIPHAGDSAVELAIGECGRRFIWVVGEYREENLP